MTALPTPDLRSATAADAGRLREIYAYYVERTAVTFEIETPSVDEFRARVLRTLERYPYLVLEADGAILGYAYAGPFVGRAAYSHCAELSVYLDRSARRQGYGRALYGALAAALQAQGILNLYACIADPETEDEYLTHDSERFHERLGFTRVGIFHRWGRKFGRWYNMIWMEKLIGPAPSRQDAGN